MAKLDPEKTARNKIISDLTAQLKEMLPQALKDTGASNEQSLHANLATRKAQYIDLMHEVIYSAEHYVSLFIKGLNADLKAEGETPYRKFYKNLYSSEVSKKYLYIFLHRTYLREFENLSKKRPNTDEATIWIGQNNADYGLLVAPYFSGAWVNDKSEIRRFRRRYWSVGHILETGLVVPNRNETFTFSDVDEYLKFFEHILVRNTASPYQKQVAALYSQYVRASPIPEEILLLIPEFRYGGINTKHEYRLDFCIIDVETNNKIGFEFSPWSTHGKLTGTKTKKQSEINSEASANFSKEMKKHRDYFKKYGIFSLIFTDTELADIAAIFSDIEKYLQPQRVASELQLHIISEFFES